MRKMRRVCFLMAGMMLFAGCQKDVQNEPVLEQVDSTEAEADAKEDSIFVYVCGAVECEGVYELPEGSRVYEAIAAAGGFREDAAVTEINQAEVLKDEVQIYVPTEEEVKKGQASKDGKINLNTATKAELMTLSGIGETKADSIIRYREEHGKFQSIEDIKNIDGIKDGLFERIKNSITV